LAILRATELIQY